MIDVIEEFLQNISNRLIVYYKADLSMVYLHKMVEHLKTFFDDIIAELDEKSTKIRDEIEGNIKNVLAITMISFCLFVYSSINCIILHCMVMN